MAIKLFLPYPVTYLCEVKFSSYTINKTTQLNVEADVRIHLSSIKLDFSFLFFFFFWPHCGIWNSQARNQIQATLAT